MNFEISARGIEVTGTVRARVERRLRFADRIERVRVVFSDGAGPESGHDDSYCGTQIAVHGQLPAVRLEQADCSVDAVVDWATDRVGRAVARRLDHAMAVPGKWRRPEPDMECPRCGAPVLDLRDQEQAGQVAPHELRPLELVCLRCLGGWTDHPRIVEMLKRFRLAALRGHDRILVDRVE